MLMRMLEAARVLQCFEVGGRSAHFREVYTSRAPRKLAAKFFVSRLIVSSRSSSRNGFPVTRLFSVN